METLSIAEVEFAKVLGVSRADLKRIRGEKLTLGVDWVLGAESRGVEITLSGQKKMRAALGLPQAEPDKLPPAPEKKEGGGRAARYVALVVVKAATGNRVVVVCTDPEGKPVRLRVRDNGNFIRGMRVPTCVHVEADRYDYEGRLPRRKGRL